MGLSSLVLYTTVIFINSYAYYGGKKMHEIVGAHKGPIAVEFQHMQLYEYCYATNWTFILQNVFISIAILDELLTFLNFPSKLQRTIGKIRSLLFSCLVFPCSLFVVIFFWSIWAVDRELIFPKVLDTLFPMWLNHLLHTFILIPLIIEIILSNKNNSIKFRSVAPVLIFYAGIYQLLYFSIYIRDGVWLYPIYKVLSSSQMFIFNVIQMLLLLGLQYVGLNLQNINRKEIKTAKKIR